jgi:hypothetical protein
MGPRWRSWLKHCATNRQVAGLIPIVSVDFFISIILSVDSASNRNEYQEYLLRGKGGRCVWLTTYHFHMTTV